MNQTIELKIPAALKCAAEKVTRKKGLTRQQFMTATIVQIMEDYDDMKYIAKYDAELANGKKEKLIEPTEVLAEHGLDS